MNDSYIVINGKKTELTEEQLKALGIEMKPTRKNPFEKVVKGFTYYIINRHGDVDAYTQTDDAVDDTLLKCCNYFNDKSFAKQVALHQLLYRKLLKFAYDNGCEDTAEWNRKNQHWCIYYSNSRERFDTTWHYLAQYSYVYFSTREGVQAAIEEVVEPFMKEHPDFVW